MNIREYVPRKIYYSIKKKLRIRAIIETLFCWVFGIIIFFLLLYFGSFPLENQEYFYFRDHANIFFERFSQTAFVIFPTLFMIIGISWGLLILDYFIKKLQKRILCTSIPQKTKEILTKTCSLYLEWIVVFSAIPPFITAIFFIKWMDLDTINNSNLIYAVVCLTLFNLQYSYNRLSHKFKQAYQEDYILFARSLGIANSAIFRHYILPNLVRDYCTLLRELVPHLIVESTILEYTFGYNGLMRSALESLRYHSWHYFIIFLFAVILFATFFDILFRCIEDYLAVREG